jgi:LCP family protein required for cell wall assembly
MQVEPNHGSPLRKNKMNAKPRKRWRTVFGLVLIAMLLLGGLTWWEFNGFLNKITANHDIQSIEGPGFSKDYKQEPLSLVIIGKDSRQNLGLMNTDVIIVTVLDPHTKRVTMVSLPRDTGVRIPGYKGFHKINSVYSKGERERRNAENKGETFTTTGPSLLKETLESIVGIPIKHYAMVDFEGFERIIDKLGGIEVDVEKSMKYNDPTDGTRIDLEPGVQSLSGEQALGYVRHRLDDRGSKYYSTDFERGARQQIVIRAMVDKMKSFTGISNFFSVLDVAGDHVRTDLSKGQITGLIKDFKSIGSENITSLKIEGGWDGHHVILDQKNLKMIRSVLTEQMGVHSKLSTESVKKANDSPPKVIPAKPDPNPQDSSPEQETDKPAGEKKDTKEDTTSTTSEPSGTLDPSVTGTKQEQQPTEASPTSEPAQEPAPDQPALILTPKAPADPEVQPTTPSN